jgi:dienelactone hydrolase
MPRLSCALALAVLAGIAIAAPARAAFDPVVEAQNYRKTLERQELYNSPSGRLLLEQVSRQNLLAATKAQATDPERQFATDLCWNGGDGCAGDARLYEWQRQGYGIVQPVLFTARSGATLSGHVWATRSGPAQRPGVVITNGSVQADEQMYWYAAQALAKAGYVVLTFDPQGQGQSDTRGEAPDENEGFPAQSDGRPFFDGTMDALDFFFSTPEHPYVPKTSCDSGTSHAPKQERRAAAGLSDAYNPFWSLFDRDRVGLAGHSYGAAGVSYVGQLDPRVDAIVAWDNLSKPTPGNGSASFPPGAKDCPAHPEDRVDPSKDLAAWAPTAKPALGMAADYFLPPTPNTSEPPSREHCDAVAERYAQGEQPAREDATGCKSLASKVYSKYGVDTGELVIRGGSHLDFSFISNPAFGATLRGADMIDWYTTAWFDKYVKRDPTADARLLTNRWRHDGAEATVDPKRDGNMFSFYHPSRLDFHTADGTRVTCEELRAGCAPLTEDDGYRGEYSYLAIATSPDGDGAPGTPQGTGIYRDPPPELP